MKKLEMEPRQFGVRATKLLTVAIPYKTETDSQTYRTDLWLPRGSGEGVGWTRSLGLADANYYIQDR